MEGIICKSSVLGLLLCPVSNIHPRLGIMENGDKTFTCLEIISDHYYPWVREAEDVSGLGEDAVVEAGQALGEAGAGGAVPQPSPAPLARDAEVQRPAQL